MAINRIPILAAVTMAMVALLCLLGATNPSYAAMSPVSLFWPLPITVDPPPGGQGIAVTSTVFIDYGEPIDPGTVSTRTFSVHAMQTGLITRTYVVSGGRIELAPEQHFKPNEIVQVSATTGTLNLNGDGPLNPTVWTFRTGSGDALGLFGSSTQLLSAERPYRGALGDLDGDGDLDAVVINEFIDCAIFFNDGSGYFTLSDQHPGMPSSRGVVLGDLDRDGDLDALVSRGDAGSDRILINDGHGTMINSLQGLGVTGGDAAAFGDIDGDGDLDAITAGGYDNQTTRVWVNNGSAIFAETQILGTGESRSLEFGDLDADGDLDAFVTYEHSDRVYLNDGAGRFQVTHQGLGDNLGSRVFLEDLDGDGDLDAMVLGYDGLHQSWLNTGVGIFEPGQTFGLDDATDFASGDMGDLDHDGDLDMVISNYLGGQVDVEINNGQGVFSRDTGFRNYYSQHSADALLGDLDGDSDLDVFMLNDLSEFGPLGVSSAQVWFNANVTGTLVIVVNTVDGDATFVLESESVVGYFGVRTEDHTASIVLPNLAPGVYDFREDQIEQGWELVSQECDNGDSPRAVRVAPAATTTCVFTNRRSPTASDETDEPLSPERVFIPIIVKE